MLFDNLAVIFAAPDCDPNVHRAVIKTDTITYTTIGVDSGHRVEVIEVAKQAVEDGAQISELRGGFGPIWMARLVEALKGAVPAGGVFYGPEARVPLVALGLT